MGLSLKPQKHTADSDAWVKTDFPARILRLTADHAGSSWLHKRNNRAGVKSLNTDRRLAGWVINTLVMGWRERRSNL